MVGLLKKKWKKYDLVLANAVEDRR